MIEIFKLNLYFLTKMILFLKVFLVVRDHPLLLKSMDPALIVNRESAKELVQGLKEPHQYWVDKGRF